MRTAVIFVHGFGSSGKCWDPIFKLLRGDSGFGDSHYVKRFEYETKWLDWNPLSRLPDLTDLGNSLGEFLRLDYADSARTVRIADCDRWILVGHSQGGLVIQSYLGVKIDAHLGAQLAKIRCVVLFATPTRGSETLTGFRRAVSQFLPNVQEKSLRVLDGEVARLSRVIERDILGASRIGPDSCPIPFMSFWGTEDSVVPKASAQASFPETAPVPGTHFSLIKPKDDADRRYLALRDALLNPLGPPAMYDVDVFETRLEVFPYPTNAPYVAQYGGKTREVHTDNRARRSISVTFSAGNRCKDIFRLKYATLGDGFVRWAIEPQENRASAEEVGAYDREGKTLVYKFEPEPSKTYSMSVEIYNGFGDGNRTWHYHVPANMRCRDYRLTLDLRAYAERDYEITQPPAMYLYPHDIECSKLCSQREHGAALPFHTPQDDPRVWVWNLDELRGGVVDLVWELARKHSPLPAASGA